MFYSIFRIKKLNKNLLNYKSSKMSTTGNFPTIRMYVNNSKLDCCLCCDKCIRMSLSLSLSPSPSLSHTRHSHGLCMWLIQS